MIYGLICPIFSNLQNPKMVCKYSLWIQ